MLISFFKIHKFSFINYKRLQGEGAVKQILGKNRFSMLMRL